MEDEEVEVGEEEEGNREDLRMNRNTCTIAKSRMMTLLMLIVVVKKSLYEGVEDKVPRLACCLLATATVKMMTSQW